MKFKKGDRVRLNKKKLHELEDGSAWEEFNYGVVTEVRSNSYTGYGSALPDSTDTAYGVRWDEYGDDAYKTPGNCHTADGVLLLLDEPDEDELAEALLSIEQAARKTMSTRRLP